MKGGGLLAFAFGAFVGAVTAYGYFASKYATDAPKDKDKVINTAPPKPELQKTVDGGEVMPDDQVPKNVVVNGDKVSQSDIMRYNGAIVDYTSFSKDDPDTVQQSLTKPKIDPGLKMSEERDKRPELITYAEFGVAPDGQDRETDTLLYFVDEGILTNEQQEIIDDPEAFVGDTLDTFTQEPASVLLVRNYKLGIDYNVTKMAGHLL